MLIEGFAADNCAGASEADRAQLQRAFANYASSVTTGQHDAAAMAYVELHVAVVGLTGNKTLARLEHELMIGSLLLVDIITRCAGERPLEPGRDTTSCSRTVERAPHRSARAGRRAAKRR